MKSKFTLFSFMFLFSFVSFFAQGDLRITEIMFDVPADSLGDANGDGVRGSRSDEFVELYNAGTLQIDLTAYQIVEREGVPVFTFPVGATIDPGQFVVVFGSVGPNGFGSNIPEGTGLYTVNTTTDGANVGFNNGAGKSNFSNSSDRVMIVDALLADTVAEVYWRGPTGQPNEPMTADAIFLAAPNTISGDSIYGAIRQSVTHDINSEKWDMHTFVTGNLDYLFSPGTNAKESIAPPPPTITITEIMFDVPLDSLGDANGDGIRGSKSDEFVEIYNFGLKDVDLTGFQILDSEGIDVYTFPDGAILEPNQFGVVFGAVGSAGYSNIPPATKLFEVQQSDDNVGFNNGSGKSNFSNSKDAVLLVNSAVADTVVEVYWGSTAPQTADAIYLGPPNTISGDSISGKIRKSVTHKLDSDLWDTHTVVSGDTLSLFSPGANAPKKPVVIASDIIITEIMFDVPPDSLGDANGDGVRGSRSDEFIELYNKSSSVIDLSGYQLLESNSIAVYTFPSGATINPGQFVVVFGAVGPNGYGTTIPSETGIFEVQVTTDDANVGFNNSAGKSNLSQSGDCVALINPAINDTLIEVYWGSANQISSKAIYLNYPNTLTGNDLSGSIDQSVTRKLDNDKWDIHTVVSESDITLFSPGTDAEVITGLENVSNKIPNKFTLLQNYPNPFNPSTVIEFSIPKESSVSLIIYDILGREIATLVNKKLKAGYYNYTWNATNLSSGIYLYKFSANNNIITKKMLLVK
ncbi:MAG: lamin tail domain-containing protein [Melioribacteraceae bacterium]|nr:lamin tail domain-containing protein [Melioribacteraceae bacterium]